MATLWRPNFAHFLIVTACSSADPSGGNEVWQGVDALEDLACQDECYQQYIEGAALAQGEVWITRNKSLEQCNGNCSVVSESATLAVATIGADGGVENITATPEYASAMSSGVGVSPDGASIFFGYGDPVANQMVFRSLTASGADAGSVTSGSRGTVIGIAADGRAGIFAVADSSQQPGGNIGFDNGNSSLGNNSGSGDVNGVISRVNFDDGGIDTLDAVPFDPQGSSHLFTADATNVYWIGNGTVWSVPRDLKSAPQQNLATIPNQSNCGSSCTVSFPVGLAVSNGVVAWATLSGTDTGCAVGPCDFTNAHCQISTTSALIYDAPGTACMGLAIDDAYAYFAIVVQKTIVEDCCHDDDGGKHTDVFTATSAVARISLTGAPNQPASQIPLDTERFYGPRRLFVDDSFVYGIDPAYVLRVAKSAFP